MLHSRTMRQKLGDVLEVLHSFTKLCDRIAAGLTVICDHEGSAWAMGQERGDQRQHQHCQFIIRLVTTVQFMAKLRHYIRRCIGVLHGDNQRCKVSVQLFSNQSWSRMLGYCQKDQGQPHYRFAKYGVSDDEAAAGIDQYQSVPRYAGLTRAQQHRIQRGFTLTVAGA